MASRRHDAVKLAQQGYRILPLDGKRPAQKDWVNLATSNARDVSQVFTEYLMANDEEPNIGIAAGSGLLVLDCDPRNGGIESVAELEADIGKLPKATVRTGGGGYHWYFTTEETIGNGKLLPGLDFKGVGGQVVAPGSTHPETGKLYKALNGMGTHPLPEGLLTRLRAVRYEERPDREDGFVVEGTRDTDLTSLAGWMRREGASQNQIEVALIALAKEANLPLRDAKRIARSIAKKADGFDAEVAKALRNIEIREAAQKQHRRRNEQVDELPDGRLYDVLQEELIPPRYTVHELHLTGGNTLFIAQRKAGKTTVAMNLVRCLADDELFLGEFEVEHEGHIGYLNYELMDNLCWNWLKDMTIHNQRLVHVLHRRGRPMCLWLGEGRKRLVEWLQQRKITTLVVDPAVQAWRGVVENENDNTQVQEFASILDEVKAEAGVQDLYLIHHIGKSHTEEGAEHGRGASSIEGWADSLWLLTRDMSGTRSFSVPGGRVPEREAHDLDYDPNTRTIMMVGTRNQRRIVQRELIREVEDQSNMAKLLQVVAEFGPISKQAIRKQAGWGNALNQKMVAEGLSKRLMSQATGSRNSVMISLTERGVLELESRA